MALIVEIKAEPSSGRQMIVLDKSGMIKCFLKSAPQKGEANRELIILLAKLLDLPKQNITIMLGAITRKKRIKIDADITYKDFLQKLGIDHQEKIDVKQ